MTVKDNGVGIPESIDIEKADSLGLSLISTLTKGQLEGEFDINRKNGTAYYIRFRKKD